MIEQGYGAYMALIMSIIAIVVISNFIPLFGFLHKRWKGLAWGCLAQLFALTLGCVLVVFLFHKLLRSDVNKKREAAMVTVKKEATDHNWEFWYLKPDEECLYEYNKTGNKDLLFLDFHDFQLYDVLLVDSNKVCVDDKIFVSFDLKGHKVSATEFDEPLEIVHIDWDKVSEYFKTYGR